MASLVNLIIANIGQTPLILQLLLLLLLLLLLPQRLLLCGNESLSWIRLVGLRPQYTALLVARLQRRQQRAPR